MLISLSGLPGTGKTTIARLLARSLPAVHVRVDSIEQALVRSGLRGPIGPEGYVAAYAVAVDNLRLGHHVIADCVNAAQVSRDAWEDVARACQADFLHVHLVCDDADEHRRRVSERKADIQGHVLPGWDEVSEMSAVQMRPPPPGALLIDTAACSADRAVDLIMARAK